jgi:alkylation response protein AidB-like acyl-CoA dehydrogenase
MTLLNETEGVREGIRDELTANDYIRRARAGDETRHGADAWAALAGAGWTSVGVSEDDGGAGGTAADLAAVCWEIGRVLGPTRLSLTVAAINPALAASPWAASELLPGVIEGRTGVTVALPSGSREASIGWRRDGSDVVLSGACDFVLDPLDCEWVLVEAVDESGARGVFAVPREELGVTPTPLIDRTRSMGTISADGVRVAQDRILELSGIPTATTSLSLAVARAIGHESGGGTERVLEITLAYAKQREQFGRPLGSFQVLKHALADMFRDARAASVLSGATTDADRSDALVLATKAELADGFARVAGDGIRIHGGIGYTWEHDMHFFVKRAEFNRVLYGSSRWCREQAFLDLAS